MMRRTVRFVMRLVVGLLLLLAGVPTARAAEVVRVTVFRGTQMFPVYIMQKYGFAQKHGIELRLNEVVSVEGIFNAQRAKASDIVHNALITNVLFRSQGLDVVNLFSMTSYVNEVLVRKDAPFQSFADLKGKKIAYFDGPAGSVNPMFRILCVRFFGFDPAKESSIQYGAPPLLAGLLERGAIDAALLLEPLVSTMLLSGKFRSLGNLGDLWAKHTGQPSPALVTISSHDEFVRSKPVALRGYVAAYADAAEYMRTHPEVWTELAPMVGVKTPEGIDFLRRRIASHFKTRWDAEYIEQQKAFLRLVREIQGPQVLPSIPDGAFSLEFVPGRR